MSSVKPAMVVKTPKVNNAYSISMRQVSEKKVFPPQHQKTHDGQMFTKRTMGTITLLLEAHTEHHCWKCLFA